MNFKMDGREYSFGELLLRSWDVYQNKFVSILIITLLVYIPINSILYFTEDVMNDMNGLNSYLDIIQILENLVGIIATMGIAVIVESAFNNSDSDWKNAIGRALSRWLGCVGTNLLAGLILLGLFILLVVPAIIWSVYYIFVIQVVVLKGFGGKEALDYSKSLVKGRWWKLFGISALSVIISVVLGLALGFVDAFSPGFFSIFTSTVLDVFTAFFTVVITVYFLNLDYKGETDYIS